jgi:hypothetical protein
MFDNESTEYAYFRMRAPAVVQIISAVEFTYRCL